MCFVLVWVGNVNQGLWERQWLEKWIGNHFQRGGIQKCGSGQKHLPWLWSWNIPIWKANWPKVALVWAECMSLPYYSQFLKGLTSSGESQVYFPITLSVDFSYKLYVAAQAASNRWSSFNSELLHSEDLDFNKGREKQELIQKFAFHPSQT